MANKINLNHYTMEDYVDFPDIFIESFCIIKGLSGLVNFQLWDVQKDILKQIEGSDHIAFVKYDLSGMTTLMCGYVLWYLFTHKNDTVYFVCDSQFMVKKVFDLIKLMAVNIKSELRFGSQNILHTKNNTLLRLVHKVPKVDGDLIIVDEADNLPKSSDLKSVIRLFKKTILYSVVFWDKDIETEFRSLLTNECRAGKVKQGRIMKTVLEEE